MWLFTEHKARAKQPGWSLFRLGATSSARDDPYHTPAAEHDVLAAPLVLLRSG